MQNRETKLELIPCFVTIWQYFMAFFYVCLCAAISKSFRKFMVRKKMNFEKVWKTTKNICFGQFINCFKANMFYYSSSLAWLFWQVCTQSFHLVYPPNMAEDWINTHDYKEVSHNYHIITINHYLPNIAAARKDKEEYKEVSHNYGIVNHKYVINIILYMVVNCHWYGQKPGNLL